MESPYRIKRERGEHDRPAWTPVFAMSDVSCDLHDWLRSGGQNLAALGTAAGKHLAAVGSSHSLTETVNLGTVTAAGLIGTLHLVYTSCQNHLCSTAGKLQQHILLTIHSQASIL